MTIKDIVKAYADELYNWYITKDPIKSNFTAVKALFEIDWIAEYDDEDNSSIYIKDSTYWKEM